MAYAKDLVGQIFGRWTVVERAGRSEQGRNALWLCECSCGTRRVVIGSCLRSGVSLSCGCHHRDVTSQMALKDETGKTFGQLVVLQRVSMQKSKTHWLCQCECGELREVQGDLLRRGEVTCCLRCAARERRRQAG